jgi:hypothetical protein
MTGFVMLRCKIHQDNGPARKDCRILTRNALNYTPAQAN